LRAREIWQSLPHYRDQPIPAFSNGWIDGFKARHNLKERILHGEAGSVAVTAESEMVAVRTLCGEYEEDEVYNMDETGLFWRNSIHRGLTSENAPGRKKDKSRITVVVCTNASGSDRYPLWFIGHSKVPRALKGINFTALGCTWRSNKKAWMNTGLMVEWLQAFYKHIGTRKVILTMDNLKAHINGVEEAPPPSNIHIIWLPKNSTSVFQPLDQGIIQNLKIYYRKQWMRFIVDSIDQQRNPSETVTLYETIHWCLTAWNDQVTNTTIYRCFRKSTIIQPSITLPSEPPVDASAEYNALL
jgi:hypothetical protein